MSAHNRVYREGVMYQSSCTCGWEAYGARYRYEADEDLTRHLTQEWDKEKARAATEKERIRLLTQGQNWDTP